MIRPFLTVIFALSITSCVFAGTATPAPTPTLTVMPRIPQVILTPDWDSVEVGGIITVRVEALNLGMPQFTFRLAPGMEFTIPYGSNELGTPVFPPADPAAPFEIISTERELAYGTIYLRAVRPGSATLSASATGETVTQPYSWTGASSDPLTLTAEALPPGAAWHQAFASAGGARLTIQVDSMNVRVGETVHVSGNLRRAEIPIYTIEISSMGRFHIDGYGRNDDQLPTEQAPDGVEPIFELVASEAGISSIALDLRALRAGTATLHITAYGEVFWGGNYAGSHFEVVDSPTFTLAVRR